MDVDIVKASSLTIRVLILLALVFALLFVLTWTNTLKCKSIPFWCDGYYAITGKPDVLIVYGEDGLGDPAMLAEAFRNPNIAGVHAKELRLDSANIGNLKEYEIVIVTRARTMSSEKVKMFIDYANGGGNLVWTGDAGAEAVEQSGYLRENEKYLDTNSTAVINPWARKHDGRTVMLNKLLSVNYAGNYCGFRKCHRENAFFAGMLEIVSRENPLVYGFNNLKIEVFEGQDFAITEPLNEGTSTTIATIDFGSSLVAGEENHGNHLPMIISNAKSSMGSLKIGENVFYYAMPPEHYVNPRLSAESRYGTIISNLYHGIIYG